ncbi:MAG: hypothetical protein AAGH19_06055, partial [Pseudomonadota bacterium]
GLRGAFPDLTIVLESNPALDSLEDFGGLSGQLGGFWIIESPILKTLAGLEQLTQFGSNGLLLQDNPMLESIEALSGLSGEQGSLEFRGNPELLDLEPLAGVTSVENLVVINSNLDSLEGLRGLTTVTEGLTLAQNPRLRHLDDLSRLRGSGFFIEISSNENLENIDGLAGLSGELGSLSIRNNPKLQHIDALKGISALRLLSIEQNETLENINGLASVRSVLAVLDILNNPSLVHLDGLANLEVINRMPSVVVPTPPPPLPISLNIQGNENLTDCAGLGRVLGYPTLPFEANSQFGPSDLVLINESNGEGAQSPDDCLSAYADRLPPTLPDFELALHGSWFDPFTSGEGVMMFTAPNQAVTLYYYSYDADGQPAWQVATADGPGAWNEPIEFTVFDTKGGVFSGLNPEDITAEPVGSMTLTVWDCRTGRLDMDIPGRDRSLALDRIGTVVASPCNNHPGIAPPPPMILPGVPPPPSLTGAWYDPATDGQGFTLHHVSHERGVAYFFGYRDDGSDLWLIGTWEEPLSFETTLQIPLRVFQVPFGLSSRGFFNSDPESQEWGTLTLRLDDCSNGEATLTGLDGTQTLDLQLLAGAAGLPCGSPAEAAP